MIRALEYFGWLHYVQEKKNKQQRVIFIEKIFEDGNNLHINLCDWISSNGHVCF